MLNARVYRITKLVLAALALLLAGCHEAINPHVMDDPAWSSSPESVMSLGMADKSTADLFAGVDSLDAGLMGRLVLARHPAVLAAEARVNETAARNKVAGRLPNPELESRMMYRDGERTLVEGGLMFSMPISGRLGAAGRVSDADLALAEADLRNARKQALIELDGILFELEGARKRLALNEELAARSGEYAELARTRLSASIADPLDVSLVVADAASDRRAVTRSRQELARIDSELHLLVGLEDGHPWIVTTRMGISEIDRSLESLTELAQRHCESLLRARLEYQRAEWKAQLASRERIPDLLLGPIVEFEDDQTSVGVGFGIPVPIFNTGSAEYKASLAHRDAAWKALEFETRAVDSRIFVTLNRLEALDAALVDLVGEVSSAVSEAFDLAKSRYLAGRIDVLHLLSAHRSYASVQLEIINITVARHEALLELESVIGFPLHENHILRQLEVRP